MNMMKKTLVASGVALALGASVVNAAPVENLFGAFTWSSDSANFTMLDDGGGTTGGSNDVQMDWDGNGFTASSDYTGTSSVSNVTASSTTLFFNHNWTAHDIQVFVPGSYSFDTALEGGNNESGILNVTVPTGGLGMHMLFDWNNNLNIDVFVVAANSVQFGSGVGRFTQATAYGNACDDGTIQNCLHDGKGFGSAGKPAGDQVWMLASTDGDNDGIMGIPMAPGGPFELFNANFNANLNPTAKQAPAVPVPAAVWLFGSGLLGLVGVARRKKST